jgi:hypothetical protein
MTDIKSRANICSQSHIEEEQPFMIVAVVRDEMSGQFNKNVGIAVGNTKSFILCSCQLLEDPQQTILYLSNDPSDFIYNYTGTARNNGIMPIKKRDNNFLIDINKIKDSKTVGFPINHLMNLNDCSKIIYNDLEFYSVDGNLREISSEEIHYGVPYKVTFAGGQRINFYTRKNVTTVNNGLIGPSIAHFSSPSTIFENLKSASIALEGTDFLFNASKKNEFGMSKLNLEVNSAAINLIPQVNSAGIMELKQGTSTWYNIFHNPTGTSTVYLKYNTGDSFLNTDVYNPSTAAGGISVKINLRNKISDFITTDSITPGVSEVYDYYFVNMRGFTVGGLQNNSSQYFNKLTGDVHSGLCYFMNKDYTYHNFFHKENMKGTIHNLNCLNNTPIARTTVDSSKMNNSITTEDSTVYSNYYESLYGIDLNKFNDYSGTNNCGNRRSTENPGKNLCTLYGDSDKAAQQGKPIFTSDPGEKEQTFIIEMVVMSVLVFIYIAFAIYYYNLKMESTF